MQITEGASVFIKVTDFSNENKNMGEFLVNVLLKYNAIIQLLSKG